MTTIACPHWRDNDPRSRGTGEFTVIKVEHGAAVVHRHDTGRRSTIRVDRLLRHTNRRTGYTYLGRAR